VPHAESYHESGDGGPRVDLFLIDAKYAKQRLDELIKWKDPSYREALFQKYADRGGYSAPHRHKQLSISPNGLEQKIQEFESLITDLDSAGNENFVSDRTAQLEDLYESIIRLIESRKDRHQEDHPTETRKQKASPSEILSPTVVDYAHSMTTLLLEVLDFVRNHPNVKIGAARNYWQEVDSWAEL